jgi:hypothetical protein
MRKAKLRELLPLLDFINESYDGDLARLAHDVDRAVYLLHLIERGRVSEEDTEDVSYVLHMVSQQLFKSYLRKATDQ